MDTGSLKNFSTLARNALLHGVYHRIEEMGFDSDGNVVNECVRHEGGATFDGKVVSLDFFDKWNSLRHAIEHKSVREVTEEAAYTWFNRLIAIWILEKNGLISPTLKYESEGIRIPLLVTEARRGRLPHMDVSQEERVRNLLKDDTKSGEQFRELIVPFCHDNPIIRECFGRISDYTELLLPVNILSNDGLVDMLNNTGFILEEDYSSPELLGWLYQFYISDRKDEVFAKKGKYTSDEIPAATQIFTPNWIVKYMVQNTVGRIYLDNNPSEKAENFGWKYMVEPYEPKLKNTIYQYDNLEDLKLSDLSCGSGHILNEFFDILYDLYLNEGYSSKIAIESIFKKNIIGVDIDTRAKQLATFALLLKACQKDRSFADAHCMPRVYDMVEPYEDKANLRVNLIEFLLGNDDKVREELVAAIELMNNAKTLGSIMKFEISERTRNIISVRMEEYSQLKDVSEPIQKLLPYMRLILVLTESYSALVMNPPYMGGGKMNKVLSDYVKSKYVEGKADLCTVFMLMQAERVGKNGFYANIVPPSWMFISSFENLRRLIIENNSISSMLHLSRGVFGADFGSVSSVIQNRKDSNSKGTYFRLIERTFQEFDQKHLKLLFEKTLANHDFRYYFVDYSKDVNDIEFSEQGAKIYYPNISQSNFERIPGCSIGYWVSEKMINNFDLPKLSSLCDPRTGLSSSDNNRFLRHWFEVCVNRINFKCSSLEESKGYAYRWYPIQRGGGFRRWYGLNVDVINWENNGEEIKGYASFLYKSYSRTIKNIPYYFLPGISWSYITSGKTSFRKFDKGHIIINAGPACFNFEKYSSSKEYIMGLLNSVVAHNYLTFLSPTINFDAGPISNLPYKKYNNLDPIINTVNESILISQQDWDSHETSWDFKTNELLTLNSESAYTEVINDRINFDGIMPSPDTLNLGNLEWLMEVYKTKWETKFMQLHANEEELNRQFIEIYGLHDELTPDVPYSEITILQQGEITVDDNNPKNPIRWNDDVIMGQLVSYAVGCMMGRYSIDKPGLILANQGDGIKEYEKLVPNSHFDIDDDGIVPLMSNNPNLNDNATLRFKRWMSIVFGEDKITENLNYVEKCLGKSIEEYFSKDFWNNHKKMYQNRPIYWLFASKKKAFQCIVYMHRMNAYTVERIRTKYLLPHIEWLVNRQKELQANAADLTPRERRELDNVTRQIVECREYHNRLHTIADKQIDFNLDDGVVVNYAKFGDVVVRI